MIALLWSESTDPHQHAGSEHLVVTVRRTPPGAVVLVVRGTVDLLSSPLLRDQLLPHVRPPVPRVIIDLTDVDFLSAAGLTALVEVRAAAEAAGIGLGLVAHTRVVLLPLSITGLDREFDIHSDLTDALAIPSPLRS